MSSSSTVPLSQQIASGSAPVIQPVVWPTSLTPVAGTEDLLFTDATGDPSWLIL